MTNSSTPAYVIIFDGELANDKQIRSVVIANLSELTGLPEDEVLDQFFSIKPIVIIEEPNKAMAEAYVVKFENAGLKVRIEEHKQNEHPYFSLILDLNLDEPPVLVDLASGEETESSTDASDIEPCKEELITKDVIEEAEHDQTPDEAILELRRATSSAAHNQTPTTHIHAHAHLHKFLAITLGVMLITIITWFIIPFIKPKVGTPETRLAEAALVQDDTALLLHADFHQLSRVNALFGNPDYHRMFEHIGIDKFLAALKKKKLDLLSTTDEIFVALDTTPKGNNNTKWVLFGNYNIETMSKLLSIHFSVNKLKQPNTYLIHLQNHNNCSELETYVLQITKNRIIISAEAEYDELISRLNNQHTNAAYQLTEWRNYRDDRFISIALINPQAIATDKDNYPNWLPKNSQTILQQLQSSYASLNFEYDNSLFNTNFVLNTSKADSLKNALQVWQPQANQINLFKTLTFEQNNDALIVDGRLDNYLVDNLSILTAEDLKTLLGNKSTAQIEAPIKEIINERVAPYFAEYNVKQLPDFDPEFDAFFRPDTSSGPFGIRLNTIRTTPNNLIELEIEAAANHIENLGIHNTRAQLFIDKALSSDNKELLRKENCGANPNKASADMQPQLASVFSRDQYTYYRKVSGTKKIRLKPDLTLDQLAMLKGKVVLTLPISTETILLNAPLANQFIEKKGTRIDFRQSQKHVLSYDIKGKPDNVLEVRALNSEKKYLAKRTITKQPHLLGTGQNHLEAYEGNIAFVEIIWATTEKKIPYTFELHHFIPQTDRAWRDTPTPVKTYSLKKFKKQFKKALIPNSDIIHGDSDGSFNISVFDANLPRLRVSQKDGILGRIWFKTPDIPSLNKTLSSLELQLSHIRLTTGDSVKTDFSSYIVMEKRSLQDITYLTGHTDLRIPFNQNKSDIYSLEGELTMRLPSSIDAIKLKDIELGGSVSANGFTMRLVELTRDTASVEIDGNRSRIITLRGFTPDNKQLQGFSPQLVLQPNGKWLGTISVTGKLDTIELITALSQEQQAFPFSMKLSQKN